MPPRILVDIRAMDENLTEEIAILKLDGDSRFDRRELFVGKHDFRLYRQSRLRYWPDRGRNAGSADRQLPKLH